MKVLVSYFYYKDHDLAKWLRDEFEEPWPRLFGDSGAYSADARGETIDVDDYMAWVRRWEPLMDVYANVDVIGDPEGTWRNQQYIESHGLSPLPVFHVGTPYEYLDRLCDNYDYLALGGMVPYALRHPTLMRHLIRSFKIIGDRARVHGFGVSGQKILRSFPWFSVDSSSWCGGIKYGRANVFDPREHRLVDIPLRQGLKWKRLEPIVQLYGYDAASFADREQYDYTATAVIGQLSYLMLEDDMRAIQGQIGLPTRPELGLGPKLYIVAPTAGADYYGMGIAQRRNRVIRRDQIEEWRAREAEWARQCAAEGVAG